MFYRTLLHVHQNQTRGNGWDLFLLYWAIGFIALAEMSESNIDKKFLGQLRRRNSRNCLAWDKSREEDAVYNFESQC